ncbi:MAG TPA: TauD/TfdA family dioxygenase [Stellaceae bacterium]|nr:TauD/TfdA family dioxygenase [Stellaceae bacterium]
MPSDVSLLPRMLDRAIAGPSAWRRDHLGDADYRVVLSAACLDEIRAAADALARHKLPTIVLDPAEFELTHCRHAMARVRRILASGVRFAVVERLPVEEIGAEAATGVYWLLAGLVARPVAQKLDGTLIYDVLDTGRQALPGSGVRPDKTNIEIRFHNDNSYNTMPPEYVALLCLRTARRGGRSRVASFHGVHNALLANHREHLPRLYRPFWFDRQREHFPDETPIFAAPVFALAGELRTRLSAHQIRGGYALRGEPIDNEGAAALETLLALFDDEAASFEFDLAPGDIEFVDNRAVAHSRTEFEDHPEPERRRHLVRLWLRDAGRRSYSG